ncbi:MAG: hypothetical protein OEQ74_00010 [Gammaproteobacteria bacterium]|nr:hypothetical protein [Gammaproteobacteria bacterium]
MIISHKYRFIFIKTVKTAGTSIEVYLSGHCGEEDIFTQIVPAEERHRPRNHTGLFNPFPEIREAARKGDGFLAEGVNTLKNLYRRKRYFPHIAAWKARCRTESSIWNNYYKFCVERNPWDKTLSHYHMLKHRGAEMSLDEYLYNGEYCLNYPKYMDEDGLILDHVIRYENLYQELGEIFARLGIPYSGSLDVRAKGDYRQDRAHYRDVLTERQRDRIADIYQREIELHGFEY